MHGSFLDSPGRRDKTVGFFFREVDFLFLFCWSHADGTGDGQERIGAPKPISPTMWPFILGQNLNHRSANILGQRK